MNVFIRADSSAALGTGHIMRSAALAHALREGASVSVTFLTRQLPPALEGNLRGAGFHTVYLPQDRLSLAADAEECKRSISATGGNALLIVDHYALGAEWHVLVKDAVSRVVVVDDVADRTFLCDLLIDSNLSADGGARFRPCVPPGCEILSGPQYALLAPVFAALTTSANVRRSLRHLLIYFGGGDDRGLSRRALEAARKALPPAVKVTVLIGAAHPSPEELLVLADSRPNTECLRFVENMPVLLEGVDLAIGAAGISALERCCLGVPSLLVALADNQLPNAAGIAAANAGVHLGAAAGVEVDTIAAHLQRVFQDPAMLAEMSARAARLVDGQGARRAAERIKSLFLRAPSERVV